MAYKYLNDDGLKAYTKKVKGAFKDLHTPIAISTENTTESKAQNVRNIADFVAKAKAAGIADVNGMTVTCLLSSGYSGVGYLYGATNTNICGIISYDDVSNPYTFSVNSAGEYLENMIVTEEAINVVTSSMLAKGARRPIILTPSTTEVDEETYQKFISDDVDVIFKTNGDNYCVRTYKEAEGVYYFTTLSVEGESLGDVWLYGYKVSINEVAPHAVNIEPFFGNDIFTIIEGNNFINKSALSPVLQEIDLTGTDAERKAKLDQFEADWMALTGAGDLAGARFIGHYLNDDALMITGVFSYDVAAANYSALTPNEYDKPYVISLELNGSLTITPLFSHLEPVEIFFDNTAEKKKKNLDNLNAYKSNLEALGVDTSNGFQVPIETIDADIKTGGVLFYSPTAGLYTPYRGLLFIADDKVVRYFAITPRGEVIENDEFALSSELSNVQILAKAVKAFGAIELKTSDNAANKAALTAYKKILTDAGISITNGYSVPVRITGNAQEYHGMLNIGTGALLSGIVTDVNETHHYPFNVNTADGVITFDANNYFLEKTSNEVTEMLDAIKYSYTPVPLTATTSTNKTQLDLFLSKVPNAQVMHCTYKDVYAGTLHKINGSWYGVLVSESNTLAGQLSIKLQADGTIVEGTA